jgi:hypothetical protein
MVVDGEARRRGVRDRIVRERSVGERTVEFIA